MDFLGLLSGFKADVDISEQTEIMQDITKTFAPQITESYSQQISSTYAPQASLQYAPQFIMSSPGASITGGAIQAPTVTTIPSMTPTISPISNIPVQEAPLTQGQTVQPEGGGSGLFDNLLTVGILAVVGYLIYKQIDKPKSKKRDVKVSLA